MVVTFGFTLLRQITHKYKAYNSAVSRLTLSVCVCVGEMYYTAGHHTHTHIYMYLMSVYIHIYMDICKYIYSRLIFS